MKSNPTNPTTNHILFCPAFPRTPMKQFFWSYNMTTHWNATHVDCNQMPLPMPPVLQEQIALRPQELERLLAMKEHTASKKKRELQEQRAEEKRTTEKRARLLAEEEARPLGRGCRSAAPAPSPALSATTTRPYQSAPLLPAGTGINLTAVGVADAVANAVAVVADADADANPDTAAPAATHAVTAAAAPAPADIVPAPAPMQAVEPTAAACAPAADQTM